MLTLISSLALLACPQGDGGGGVVINEFSYDDSGTDTVEFVELYNASDAPVDLTGWVLDSEDPFGPNTAYPITAGTILQPGDYWVMGSGLVPNVDQIVGTTNLWENGEDSLTLRDASGAIVDTLIYESNKSVWNAALAEGEGVWGNLTLIEGIETSWSRNRDGVDTDNNGNDFRLAPWTPGTSNDLASLLPYMDDFDAATVGDSPANWGGSFVRPTVVDPTVAGGANPNAIPASPEGGNAAVFWDPSGGGDACMLLTDSARDVVLEAWVYFDAVLEPATEMETWSLGLQGTTATFYNTPDPGGTFGFTANGNTGVSWTYQVTDTAATLYLVDHNDGGWGAGAMTAPTILGQIAIQPGTNDGWQRLRLQVGAGLVEGRFGGNYGMNDGQSIAGAISGSFGGVYAGYREFVGDNTTARPLTLDGLWIESADSFLTVAGDGHAGGSLTFDLAGAPPRSFAALLLSPNRGNFSLMLGMLGTLDFGVLQPIIPVALGFTDADGAVSMRFRLPPANVPPTTLYGQALTIGLLSSDGNGGMPRLTFGTSDVEGFVIFDANGN